MAPDPHNKISDLPAVLPAVEHFFEFDAAIGVHRIVEGSWSPLRQLVLS